MNSMAPKDQIKLEFIQGGTSNKRNNHPDYQCPPALTRRRTTTARERSSARAIHKNGFPAQPRGQRKPENANYHLRIMGAGQHKRRTCGGLEYNRTNVLPPNARIEMGAGSKAPGE